MRRVILMLLLMGAVAHADEEADKARGKVSWNEGITLYNLGDFAEAIRKFDEAYRIYPNPNLLFSLGQAHRQKKEYEAAIFNFRSYLRNKPDASNRAVVEELITELEQLIAAQKQSDEKPPLNVEKPPPPVPAAPPPPEERLWYQDVVGWSIAGAGVVAAGVGLVFVVRGGSQADDAAHASDQQMALDLNSSARSSRVAGGVLIGVGAAAIVAGAVKMVLYDGTHAERPVGVAVGPRSIVVSGRF